MIRPLIALSLWLCCIGSAFANDKVVLMLNWYVYGEHGPFFYGKAKGLYAAQGIDLEIQEGRGSGATVQAVAAKSADFGYADVTTMMRAAIKGAPIIAVGVLNQTTAMSVMGFADKNIRRPQDIVGKTVAITPADSLTQIWPLFLKKTGLKESDVKIAAGDAQTKLNAVINGRADLLLGAVMDQSMRIKDATGKDVYCIRFADYGINIVGDGIIANIDFVKQNQDLVRRFMAATTEAVVGAAKAPEETVDAMLAAFPKAGKRETLLQGFTLATQFYTTPETKNKPPFSVTDENMTESVALMVEYGGLDASAKNNPKQFYTNDYLRK